MTQHLYKQSRREGAYVTDGCSEARGQRRGEEGRGGQDRGGEHGLGGKAVLPR